MDIYYTENHEWAKVEGNIAFVGITEYAVSQLGDIVFIKLPDEKEYRQNDTLGELESVKAASDVYSPLSGKLVAANLSLKDSPEIINKSPQDEGWVAKLELTKPDEIKSLMTQESYDRFLQTLKQ